MTMGNWAGAAVQGVFTPVPSSGNAGARRGAWMGTPEIYFAKPIDNSRLVRISDSKRKREMFHFSVATASLFLLVMFYAWQHFSAIEYGYKIEALKKQREELVENNRSLKLQEASLRDPERIDVLARRMGLEPSMPGQVVRMDTASDGNAPVMARVTDVAVMTISQ